MGLAIKKPARRLSPCWKSDGDFYWNEIIVHTCFRQPSARSVISVSVECVDELLIFLTMEIDELISKVHETPPIWDKSSKYHYNRTIVDACWARISSEMKIDGKSNLILLSRALN